VRIWVRGEAEMPSVGGGGRFMWGLQGLKKQREREREERTLAGRKKTGEKLLFWLILDPIFSSLRPSNPPLFIGGGRGKSCLQWRKISALDSDGKDPNRWLKVGMVHCQIVKSAAAGCDVRLFASEPMKIIPRRKGMSGDQFRASFDKFGGH